MYTHATVGYNLAQDPCCFETNSSEITCTLDVNGLPPSMVAEESLLVLEMIPTNYYLVTTRSQLLVFVEYIGAGVWIV